MSKIDLRVTKLAFYNGGLVYPNEIIKNYKDETILNLQQELKSHTNVLPKEIKLESFNIRHFEM